MTRIIFTKQGGYTKSLPAVIVNGRSIFVSRITSIYKVSGGRWAGVAGYSSFSIIGGRESGGGSREWLVSWDGVWNGWISTTSMKGCIELIENC